MSKKISHLHFLLVLLLCLSYAPSTIAESGKDIPTQDIYSEDVTEIVVHSSPLADSRQEYAGSASIYQPYAPENPVNIDLTDIIDSTANFSFAGGTSSPRFLQIRGVGELEQYEGAPNPSVGLVFDDFDLSGLGLPMTLFDVEQIEILRGPQATKFGANGLAGVMTLHSSEPTPYKSLRAQLGIGSDNYLESGLAFGDSVLDSKDLFFRISLANEQSDGFRKNLYFDNSDTNSRESTDSRLLLRYQPSHKTIIDVETIFAKQNDGYDAFALNNAFTTQSDRPGKDNHDLTGAKLAIEHTLDNSLQVESISSVSQSDLDYGFDGDWGNNEFWGMFAPYDYRSASDRERDVFSQEFRLSYSKEGYQNWLLGLFAQKLDEDSDIQEFQDELVYDSLESDYEAKSYAAFFALEEEILEDFFLGSSFRAEYRDTSYNDSNAKNFNPDFNMQGGSVYGKYAVSELDQLYALASRGFKGGGFNTGTRIPDELTEYQPETLWNYEVGANGSSYNSDLKYNISLFWMQRYDQQLKLALQDDPTDPLSFSYLTDNAASGRNFGLEAEVDSKIGQSLLLELSLGLLDTKIEDTASELSYLEGREQSSAPSWNLTFATRYLISDYWYFRPSITAEDSYYFDDSHDQKSDSYYLLNCELGWTKDNLKVALWGKNLTDEEYAIRGFYFGNEPPDFPNKLYIQRGDPASFGLSISYLF